MSTFSARAAKTIRSIRSRQGLQSTMYSFIRSFLAHCTLIPPPRRTPERNTEREYALCHDLTHHSPHPLRPFHGRMVGWRIGKGRKPPQEPTGSRCHRRRIISPLQLVMTMDEWDLVFNGGDLYSWPNWRREDKMDSYQRSCPLRVDRRHTWKGRATWKWTSPLTLLLSMLSLYVLADAVRYCSQWSTYSTSHLLKAHSPIHRRAAKIIKKGKPTAAIK